MKTWCTLCWLLLLAPYCQGQDSLHAPAPTTGVPHQLSQGTKRPLQVACGISLAYGASLFALNKAWYQQYARTGFHLFNDGREWLQMDKLGHGWSAYQLARANTPMWRWAGLEEKQSLLAAGAGSLVYLTGIEWMDAHSEKWGWSWADMAANTAGTLLFAGQELAWKEQRIQFKFSVMPRRYPADLEVRARQLFGTNFAERALKDYNTQTYWLCVNLKSFLEQSRLPSWLNLAMGYGASGMYGGFRNEAFDKNGNCTFHRPDIQRSRQWYLAPDIDFTRIKTGRKAVRTLLFALNCLKLPTPGLNLEGGKLKGGFF
ncbi:DUF2279 domain-containing protein [Cnuella takakiae]|nr:DUF2279 domain-containing protein [Cnuella takakiae]